MGYISRYDRLLYHGVRLLLEAGVDPNVVDQNGDTCLHLLARHPSPWVRVQCSNLLKEAGADLSVSNCHGETFYFQEGRVWPTRPKKLTCLAALQVPSAFRYNKQLLMNQEIPVHLVPFVRAHHRLDEETSAPYIDKFFRNLDCWFSYVGKQRMWIIFLLRIMCLVFWLTVSTLSCLIILYSPTIFANLGWVGLLF